MTTQDKATKVGQVVARGYLAGCLLDAVKAASAGDDGLNALYVPYAICAASGEPAEVLKAAEALIVKRWGTERLKLLHEAAPQILGLLGEALSARLSNPSPSRPGPLTAAMSAGRVPACADAEGAAFLDDLYREGAPSRWETATTWVCSGTPCPYPQDEPEAPDGPGWEPFAGGVVDGWLFTRWRRRAGRRYTAADDPGSAE